MYVARQDLGTALTTASLGPAPCDCCHHRTRCASSGEACLAFRRFYHGKSWRGVQREPRVDVGRQILGGTQ